MHNGAVAAHDAGGGGDVVGDDPVRPLGAALGACVLHDVLGLGGKADDELRALGAGNGDGRQNVRVLGKVQRDIAAAFLLELLRGFGVRPPVRNGGGTNPVSYTHLTLPTIYSV